MSPLSVSLGRWWGRPAQRGAWRHRRFRQFFIAKLLAHLGLALQLFALTWLIARQGEGAWLNAWQQVLGTAPLLLLVLPAGLLADRVDRASLMFVTHLALMLIGLMAAAGLAGASAGALLGISAMLGVANALLMPAWQASVADMVETDELPELAQLNNLSFNLAALLGPLLGAWLFARGSVALLFLLQALAQWPMLLRCWQLARVGCTPRRADQRPSRSMARLGTLWTLAVEQAVLRRMLGLNLLSFACSAAVPVLLPALVRQAWQGQAQLLGQLQAAMGAGAVAIGLLPIWRGRLSLPGARALGCGLMAASMLLLRLPLDPAGRCACMALLGVGWALLVSSSNAQAQSFAHVSAQPPARASLIALHLLSVALGQTLGALGVGWLAQQAGLDRAWASAAWAQLALALSMCCRPAARESAAL